MLVPPRKISKRPAVALLLPVVTAILVLGADQVIRKLPHASSGPLLPICIANWESGLGACLPGRVSFRSILARRTLVT